MSSCRVRTVIERELAKDGFHKVHQSGDRHYFSDLDGWGMVVRPAVKKGVSHWKTECLGKVFKRSDIRAYRQQNL